MTDVVRKTKLATCEIVTVRTDDPFALNPFQTFAVRDGACEYVGHFTTEATALHHHDCLVKRMTVRTGDGV
jgi:hypothetical protein